VTYKDGEFPAKVESSAITSVLSSGNTAQGAVPVMIVDELLSPSGALRGLTTVPGGWGLDSVPGGCVVSTISVPGDPTNALGGVMAHEIGHFLGLFHTTEGANHTIHDPLPDTPKGVTGNLMAPTLDTMELTEGQGRVMRLHPAIQHVCK